MESPLIPSREIKLPLPKRASLFQSTQESEKELAMTLKDY